MDPKISPWLSGEPLSALTKKNGGGFRPIAVGEVLRCLVSKVACTAVKSKLPDLLLPHGQVGVDLLEVWKQLSICYKVISEHGDDPTLCC